MTTNFDEKVMLDAVVHKDARGLDLLRVFVMMHRIGYRKYGRVNAEGGITYIQSRNGDVSSPLATLVLSRDEAEAIMSALAGHLIGRDWKDASEQLRSAAEKLAVSEEENRAMRAGKKQVENELKSAQAELNTLRDIKLRHHEIMSVISAVNSQRPNIPVATALRDCCD
jgi:hypothetical protein